jgi:hypothetical protein
MGDKVRCVDLGVEGPRLVLLVGGNWPPASMTVQDARELLRDLSHELDKGTDPPSMLPASPKRIEPVKEPTEPYYYEAVGKKREVTKEIAQIMLTDRILAKLNELVAAVNQMREGKANG